MKQETKYQRELKMIDIIRSCWFYWFFFINLSIYYEEFNSSITRDLKINFDTV